MFYLQHSKSSHLILTHCFITKLVKAFASESKSATTINGKKINTIPNKDVDGYVDNLGKYIVRN